MLLANEMLQVTEQANTKFLAESDALLPAQTQAILTACKTEAARGNRTCTVRSWLPSVRTCVWTTAQRNAHVSRMAKRLTALGYTVTEYMGDDDVLTVTW